MKSDFRLIGLSKKKSFTCTGLHNEEIFWPEVGISQDAFDLLWDKAKDTDDFWEQKWIAEIQHDGLFEDGTPKDAIAVNFRKWDLN